MYRKYSRAYPLGYRSFTDENCIWLLGFPLIFANRKHNLQKLEISLEITRDFPDHRTVNSLVNTRE